MDGTVSKSFLDIETNLAKELEQLVYDDNILVYNPIEYANETHSHFVRKFLNTSPKRILFLGMNPGLFRMIAIIFKVQLFLSRAIWDGTNWCVVV